MLSQRLSSFGANLPAEQLLIINNPMKHTSSIALITYNGEKYIGRQLESIVQQTRLPDELIICDDCSTDRTVPRDRTQVSHSAGGFLIS